MARYSWPICPPGEQEPGQACRLGWKPGGAPVIEIPFSPSIFVACHNALAGMVVNQTGVQRNHERWTPDRKRKLVMVRPRWRSHECCLSLMAVKSLRS